MKKFLLATTAIAGLALATPATAEIVANDHFTVTVEGIQDITLAVVDQDNPRASQDDRKFDYFQDESEIHVTALATSDFGMKYGLAVEFQTSQDDNDNVDEAYIFMEGMFGRIEMGDEDGVAETMSRGGEDTQFGRGGIDSSGFQLVNDLGAAGLTQSGTDAVVIFNGGVAPAAGASEVLLTPAAAIDDDATKITYYTPSFHGFRAGVSYTPDIGVPGVGKNGDRIMVDNDGTFEHVFDLGLEYVETFGKVGVHLAATYQFGDLETPGVEDLGIFQIGGTVSYMGFTFGGAYSDWDDSGATTAEKAAGAGDIHWWNIGLGYETGPWAVSVGYFNSDRDVQNDANGVGVGNDNTLEVDNFAITAQYTVAPGLVVSTDLNFMDVEYVETLDNPKVKNDVVVWLVGTTVKF